MRVELCGVTKRFGRVTALNNVSFDLPPGGRMALIGPNGAGKSTLTRVIMGMLACDGEVLLDGRSPFRDRVHLAQQLAYVPQVAPRLGATVGELVSAVARLRELDRAEIKRFATELELDLEAVRKRPMRDLSGGMRQKLLLALGLSARASLLILDEPTASLDVRSRQRFLSLVGELPGKPSILLCSHRLEEIRNLVDRVLVLEDGAVAHDAGAQEYLSRCAEGVMEVMVESAAAMQWLGDRGFARSAAGWWTCEVRNGQRVELLGEMVDALGADLRDIVVRDLENLTVARRGQS